MNSHSTSTLAKAQPTLSTSSSLLNKVYKTLAVAIVAVAMLLGLSACSTGGKSRPDIIVTTNILGDVVTRMVGDTASVQVLMKPNADPHSFGISAQEAGAMEKADLIVANGLGLEEGLDSNLESAEEQGIPIVEVGEEIDPLEYAPDSRATGFDPHFWTDPARMIKATEVIERELINAVDSSRSDDISAAASDYREELKALDADVEKLLTSVPVEDRKLVTNHHVFGYMADRFDYDVIGAIIPGGSTLAAPSASDLQDLTEAIEKNNVPAIFADSSQPDRLAQVLADTAGIHVEVIPLFTESLTEPDGKAGNYIDMQRYNAEKIAGALNK